MTSRDQSTVTLRLANGTSGAAIAGSVLLAMATAAGLSPLSAERVRTRLANALAACPSPAEVAMSARHGRLDVSIVAHAEQVALLAELLDELSPVRHDDHLELAFVRPQLGMV